jgi:hypothetical protein
MLKLPKQKSKAVRRDPKTMIIFGQPKTGKTTALAELEDCLVVDLEEGTDFVSAVKIDVLKEAREAKVKPIAVVQDIIKSIKQANEKKGGYVYKYIAIDTVTALEELVLPIAASMYKETPMGRNWVGTDVTTLPNGAGYRYTREALQKVLNAFKEITDTLIILGHVKDKLVEVGGEEMNERGLDLTGKMPAILCAKVDAIGYMYRDDNKTMINFESTDSLLVGARSEHLKGQRICVAESDESNNITVDWSKVFMGE